MSNISFADQLLKVLRANPSLSAQEALLEATEYYRTSVQREVDARKAAAERNKPYYVILELETRTNHQVYLRDFGAFCAFKRLDPARLREVVEGKVLEYKGFVGGNSPNVVGSMNRQFKPAMPKDVKDKLDRLNRERVEIDQRNTVLKEQAYTPPPPTTTSVFNPNKENH